MTTYVDTSALLKRYVSELDSDRAEELIGVDSSLVTSRVTVVEIRRNLARLLEPVAAVDARRQFQQDLEAFAVIEVDAATCDLAASIAEQTGARSLDAIHLASARRLGNSLVFVTFDVRQAHAARLLGFAVAGA